jgi:hypothetical protein
MNWEARDEFVEKMFRRSGSVYSRRYYGFGVDNFREFCDGAKIREIDERTVYSVLDGYVGYLHGKGLKAKTISDHITAAIVDPDVGFKTVSEPQNEYISDDGRRVLLRLRLYSLAETSKYSARGDPVYLFNAKPEVTIVDG